MRILKVVSVCFLMIFASHVEMSAKKDGFDWEPVMSATIQIESKGNPAAVNSPYVGVLQISPVLVKEYSNILKSIGSNKHYSLSDRFNAAESEEMLIIIQSFHNPLNSIEKAIRLWGSGIRYSVAKTQAYLRKVMRHMN